MYLKHLIGLAKEKKREKKAIVAYLQALVELLLLLIDYTQAEVDFVGLFEVGSHAHDLRESFLCVVERTVAIIENTDAIPQFGLLQDTVAISTAHGPCG